LLLRRRLELFGYCDGGQRVNVLMDDVGFDGTWRNILLTERVEHLHLSILLPIIQILGVTVRAPSASAAARIAASQ
jgi:hypothetical protein